MFIGYQALVGMEELEWFREKQLVSEYNKWKLVNDDINKEC